MFTGMIESEGIITRVERVGSGMRLEVYAPEFGRDMAIGDSIAVDGACLTVIKFIRGAFLADVSEETIQFTTLGGLRQGHKVNLERALRFSDRLGGHFVTGHVDGTGSLLMRHPAGNSTIYQFSAPGKLIDYIVPKGSISVDGISLTIADTRDESFACAVIPHTEKVTTLKDKAIGDAVNLEVDMLAKYVERFVGRYVGADADASRPGRRSLGDLLREFTEGR